MVGRIASLGILLLLWSTPAPAQAPSIGTVDALVGDGSVVRFGESGARALAVGAPLYEGDRIRTDAGSRLRLAFADGTVVQLGESTDLVLDWFLHAPDAGTQNVLLRVSSGIFRVILELVLPRAAFEVQTTTAVASVRGTDWISEVTARGHRDRGPGGPGRTPQHRAGTRRRGRARPRRRHHGDGRCAADRTHRLGRCEAQPVHRADHGSLIPGPAATPRAARKGCHHGGGQCWGISCSSSRWASRRSSWTVPSAWPTASLAPR